MKAKKGIFCTLSVVPSSRMIPSRSKTPVKSETPKTILPSIESNNGSSTVSFASVKLDLNFLFFPLCSSLSIMSLIFSQTGNFSISPQGPSFRSSLNSVQLSTSSTKTVSSGKNETKDSLSAKTVNEKIIDRNVKEKSGFIVQEVNGLV